VRIALVYDCLYPNTVGGAERWLRALAERLADEHEVTYVTRRQWERGEEPSIDGVRCIAVAPGGPIYRPDGRRRLLPPLLFGAGVLLHFARHRRAYDVVHCLSYPFAPLIALRLALLGRGEVRVFCEWLEYLTPGYWREYAGPVGGALGRFVQALCLRLSPAAFAFSDLVESRLRAAGFRGELIRLAGLFAGDQTPGAAASASAEPIALFAGRHVPDKRVTILPEAVMLARRRIPALRAVIVGDGPERPRLVERIEQLGLEAAIDAPGFVPRDELERLLRGAACVVSPSVRDGYGMVVPEAAAAGTPVVVCRAPDNAATGLVEEGVNGAIAPRAAAADVADAIVRVVEGGEALRSSTAAWFHAHSSELSMAESIDRVAAAYAQGEAGARSSATAALKAE
jgi:glycosyltransferase involved in cell wall biosynthesis